MNIDDKRHETLVTWLKDAYAMEQGVVETLERQIGQMDDMPEAQRKIEQHLELTKDQAERVKECVERLGEDISRGKSAVSNILGAVQGMSTAGAKDKFVKNTMANYAIEHFEIASYQILSTAARDLGHEDIAMVCDGIRREEEQMAAWLGQQLPMVTEQFIATAA